MSMSEHSTSKACVALVAPTRGHRRAATGPRNAGCVRRSRGPKRCCRPRAGSFDAAGLRAIVVASADAHCLPRWPPARVCLWSVCPSPTPGATGLDSCTTDDGQPACRRRRRLPRWPSARPGRKTPRCSPWRCWPDRRAPARPNGTPSARARPMPCSRRPADRALMPRRTWKRSCSPPTTRRRSNALRRCSRRANWWRCRRKPSTGWRPTPRGPRRSPPIFQAKDRPLFDPLIVHLPDRGWLDRVTDPAGQRSVAGTSDGRVLARAADDPAAAPNGRRA